MRMGGGEFGGRMLRTPRGEATRPTSGMVRESLCNILAPYLADAQVLDLFAGCGSVGLEMLSHGAAHATFVESGRPALECLRSNITSLAVQDSAAVLPIPVERALARMCQESAHFDIIFLDPPFADVPAYHAVLSQTAALLAPEGLAIAQHDTRVALPESIGQLTRYRQREIGDNTLSFYRG